MEKHHRKHTHKRSSSLHNEQNIQQNNSNQTLNKPNAILISEIDSNETIKLLEQSQKNCKFQIIIDVINPNDTKVREIGQCPKMKWKKQFMDKISQYQEFLPYQMLQISKITSSSHESNKSIDYVPFRNCIRYNRYMELKTNKNNHCNSYKDLLSFNINQIGLNYQEVLA